jgi:hypothetical protein
MPRSMFKRWNSPSLDAGACIEIAGGLVGEQVDGLLISARAMATRCCCPPESWFW